MVNLTKAAAPVEPNAAIYNLVITSRIIGGEVKKVVSLTYTPVIVDGEGKYTATLALPVPHATGGDNAEAYGKDVGMEAETLALLQAAEAYAEKYNEIHHVL